MSEEDQAQAGVQRQVDEALDQAAKREAITIYEELMNTIWAKIVPTLGELTVAAIAERAIFRTGRTYDLIGLVKVRRKGFDFSGLEEHLPHRDKSVIREGFKELVGSIFDTLAKMTGNVLVKQLLGDVEKAGLN